MQCILEKVLNINRELAVIAQQIIAVESNKVHDHVYGSYSDWPWTCHRVTVEGLVPEDGNQLRILKMRKTKKTRELETAIKQARSSLRGVKDPEIREILMLRYINGLTFEQIGVRMNYANESVPRLRVRRFFRSFKSKR